MRPIPVADPEQFELACQQALGLAGWYARMGRVPHWPLSREQAINALQIGGEYEVSPGQLDDLTDRGVVSAPADGLWGAADLVQAGAVLEARRQWMPSPSLHDAKKHQALLNLEAARASDSLADRLDREPWLDIRHLLVLMTEADSREVRERLLPAVLGEIEYTHGIRL